LKLFDIDRLLDTLTGYLETKLEIFKLDLKEEIATTLSKIIIYVMIGILAILALAFTLLAVAAYVNEYLDSGYLGYLIDVAILILIAFLLYFNKKKISQAIWERIEKEDQVLNIEDEK
jgi:uncharacterized membrane protein YqjE